MKTLAIKLHSYPLANRSVGFGGGGGDTTDLN